MEEKSGAQISLKAFVQSVSVLLVLMISAGVLTLILPAGQYTRQPIDGRMVIDPGSFQFIAHPDYPIWRWVTAPLEVLIGPDSLTIITILVFLLMVGIAVAVLDCSGILKAVLSRLVIAFGQKKYTLLLIIIFFFMCLGAFFGIFEEVVPLVPLMIALSYSLGWDSLVGLGMSILATNMGFSAAITNPFTIGVAQKIAGLPLFSGAWFRIPIFLAIYALLSIFLVRYARRIEKDPWRSPVFNEDQSGRARYRHLQLDNSMDGLTRLRAAGTWLLAALILIIIVLLSGPFIPFISNYSMPLAGIIFFIGGLSAGLASGTAKSKIFRAIIDGATGIAPAIPLILMAASIKFIIAQGGILDTILHQAVLILSKTSSMSAIGLIYLATLVIEFFVSSGSAKAFLLIPIMAPLADLVGVTRQIAVTTYCFGDGFSNLIYPTNPVLLICLGLSGVSFGRWLGWTAKILLWVLVITIVFLWIAVRIGYGS